MLKKMSTHATEDFQSTRVIPRMNMIPEVSPDLYLGLDESQSPASMAFVPPSGSTQYQPSSTCVAFRLYIFAHFALVCVEVRAT